MIHGLINMLKGREDRTEPCTELSVLLDLTEFSSQLWSGARLNYALSKLGWETSKNVPELKEMGWGPCLLFLLHYIELLLEALCGGTGESWNDYCLLMALTVVEDFWVLREEKVCRMQATHSELLWWVCMARAEGNCVSSRTSVWQHFLQ